MSTLYAGGCLCGAVRFEVRGPVGGQCFCYCTSCRRAAGAPVVPWGTVEVSALRFTQGALREVRSSPGVERRFCERCGTSLTYRQLAEPVPSGARSATKEQPAPSGSRVPCAQRGTSSPRHACNIDVALACFDDLEAFAPECHLWVEEKPSWVRIGDGLPQFARGRGSAAVSAARAGYATVSARIVTASPEPLVTFIQRVFSASGEYVAGLPAELRIGDSTLLISEVGERQSRTAFLYVYVADVEGTHARALGLGARELEAPLDTPYGDRRSMIEDVWGNTWQIARCVR